MRYGEYFSGKMSFYLLEKIPLQIVLLVNYLSHLLFIAMELSWNCFPLP